MLTLRMTVAGVLVVAGLAMGAHGQAPAGKGTDDDAMKGPSVKVGEKPATLVQREMAGALVRLETRPEQAALDLLGLTAEQRKPADEVLAKRVVAVNAVLKEHYEAFIKLQTARQGGAKQDEVRPLMREFRPALLGLLKPALQDQVSDALPEAKRVEFKRIVEEYKRVMGVEEPGGMGAGAGTGGGGGKGRGQSGDDAQKPDAGGGGGAKPAEMDGETMKANGSKGAIPARVETNLVLRELGRALKGIVDERKEHMEAFLKAIDATPEQEAKIREITRAAAEAGRGKSKTSGANPGLSEPTQEEKIATWRKILDVLTPEQRKKAMESRRAGA